MEGHKKKFASLTPREKQIVVAIVDGKATNLIAEQLGVSVQTVRTHVQNTFRKLAMHSRLELVAAWHRARP